MINKSLVAAIVAAIVAASGAVSHSPTLTQSANVRPQPAHSSVVAGQETWTGRIVPASQVHLRAGSSKAPLFRGGRHSKPSTSVSSPASPTTAATAASPKVVLYNGLNQPGMASSGTVTPPDSTGAIGPNNYVEFDNSNIAVYDRSLNFISTTTLASLAGQAPSVPLCDPQVQWDPTANRWLFAYLYCNLSSSVQRLVLGWSATSDPHNLVGCPASTPGCTGWCVFALITDPHLFDYPKLGHNSNFLIVGGNLYDETNPSPNPPFTSAQVVWTHLPSNGDTSCTVPNSVGVTALGMTNGDNATPTFTPVPVNADSSAANGYIVSAYDPSGSNGGAPLPKSKLAVLHLDSGGTLHKDADVPVSTYNTPPSAAQSGTADLLDTLDARLTQAVGDPTTGIWTQHTVLNGGVSKVTWYELALSGPSLTLTQQGDITGAAGEYIFNAAISPNLGADGAAIFYNRSSATIHPLIAARVRGSATPLGTMAPGELVLATSAAADTSGASPDPVQPFAVWGTNEFNTASGTNPAWRNQNFAVVAAGPPSAPTNVSAIPGDTRACVYWTASGVNDGGFPDVSYKIREYVAGVLQTTIIASAPASSVCVSGLTNGTQYTFTVAAIDAPGESAESAPSNPVTPTRATAQSGGGSPPPRSPVDQGPSGTPPPR